MSSATHTVNTYSLVDVSPAPGGVRLDLAEHAPVFVRTGNVELVAQVAAMARLEPCSAKLGLYPDGRSFVWVYSESWSFTLIDNPAISSS